MPKQIRQTFSFILCFCNLTNALDLWNNYKTEMSLDFLCNNPEPVAFNFTLHEINACLQQHGLSCASFALPIPTGNTFETPLYNTIHEKEEAKRKIATLNREQLSAFTKIIEAIYYSNENRYFYLDGPGSAGKTYLYLTLLSFVPGKGDLYFPFATTDIAATLMKGGRTVHSGFKLPVSLLDTSVSSMRSTSKEAEELRKAVLIIIDEITMLTKDGLRCIDSLLQEVMNNHMPFGGKVFVIGGDFRQTLPVVRRGTHTDIIESCIKSSPLWHLFTHLSLTENVRSNGKNLHNTWLLNVGSGSLQHTETLSLDSIEIPHQMIHQEDLIDLVYGENFNNIEIQELSKRAILAPNKQENSRNESKNYF